MDDRGGSRELRERSGPRASSRASTASTTNTQMTPKSTSSTSSRLRDSTHTSTHPLQRHRQSHGSGSPVNTRPSTGLSRRLSQESGQSTPAVSRLLHERLQRERQVESEKLAKKLSGDMRSTTGDLRDGSAQSSPLKRSVTSGGSGPRSVGGDNPSTDDGMGAKTVGQTLSSLHKQNFDLKLELYHRRERQTNLANRINKLEDENRDLLDFQETLMGEMDQKDRAIEEAVNMIVKLEGRVEELERERAMVRQVEADGSYHHSCFDEANAAIVETPKMKTLDLSQSPEAFKSLARMPSFISEHSEHTENLRNAVLRSRSSLFHVRKISESSAEMSEVNRVMSPSLSMLSESSFVSIYGSKGAQEEDTTVLSPLDDTIGMDGNLTDRSPTPTKSTGKESWTSLNGSSPNRPSKPPRQEGVRLSSPGRSLNGMLHMDSPLQKLERLETSSVTTAGNVSRPSISHQKSASTTQPSSRPGEPQEQSVHRGRGRENVHKVLTGHHTQRELSTSHTLPPTPDTTSSSMLRKHHDLTSSQDSLSKRAENQSASVTAFSSGRGLPPHPAVDIDLFADLTRIAQSLPRRPRSAAETMRSHSRSDSFLSDSDSDDGGVDANLNANTQDYWKHEAAKKPHARRSGTRSQRGNARSSSPDLFSFPADKGGWETDVIFGALQGNGFLGSPVSALKRDPLDEMASLAQTPKTAVFESPFKGPADPPSRRSSMNAYTGAASKAPASGGKLRKSPAKDSVMTRKRSNSIDSATQVPPSALQIDGAATSRRNHYPPISMQPRGRNLGLNTLFRRAGSETRRNAVPQSATTGKFPPHQLHPLQTQAPIAPRPSGRSSVPPPASSPWALRPPTAFEDDANSATPPPIMRKRAPALDDSASAVPDRPRDKEVAPMPTPRTPSATGGSTNVTPTAPHSTGKRKWLGLGRMGSMKNRTG